MTSIIQKIKKNDVWQESKMWLEKNEAKGYYT